MSNVPVAILIVDDDEYAEILAQRFGAMGHDVDIAKDGRAGLNKILENQSDLVFLDIQMPEMDGLEVLEHLRRTGVKSTVIVMTAYGTIERAVQAMRAGAYDFLTKPLHMQEAEKVLGHAIERHVLQTAKANLTDELSRQCGEIVTEDREFLSLIEEAERAARTPSTVLLLGESGTGKELFARRIHESSPRSEGPFVAVNSAAIPEALFESELFGHEKGAFTGADRQKKGRIELAQGGTLFLDEVGDLSPATQAKLLRVIEEREFQRVGGEKTLRADVRLIAATNRDLRQATEDGAFREDLYYRLNVVAFQLRPLRERPGDIPLLARYYLRKICCEINRQPLKLDGDAMDFLAAYSWPGNVRELRNVIERIAVLASGDEVGLECLPKEVLSAGEPLGSFENRTEKPDVLSLGYHRAVRQFQKQLIELALATCKDKHNKAAELLGLNAKYLSRLKSQLGVG